MLTRAERPAAARELEPLDRTVRFHRARILRLLQSLRSPAPGPASPPRWREASDARRIDACPEQWLG